MPRTSAEWVEYFATNDEPWEAIPWKRGAEVRLADIRPLIRSLQAWQLGETSDARRLRAVARRYGAAIGDADFSVAMDCFIREEQRHGEMLGRFLDLVGAPRLRRDWGDSVFRLFRHTLSSMEVWTTVVVTIETLALTYYAAARRALPSPLFRSICTQILRDEWPHLQFQIEHLAALYAGRSPRMLRLTRFAHSLFFAGVALAVWIGHYRMLQAGGHTFAGYWRQIWSRLRLFRQLMEPTRTAAMARKPLVVQSRFTREESSRQEAPSRLEGWLH